MMQNAQMVPSPARLGLSNPHSPSFPSSQATAAVTNSAQTPTKLSSSSSQRPPTTLLSLLPPHARAISLLNQMAALTTKLFHVSGNKNSWLTSFRGTFRTFLPSQYLPPESLPSSAPSTTKQVLSLLTSLQTQLFETLSELQEIVVLEESRKKIVQEISAADSAMLAFTKKVQQVQQMLALVVDDYSEEYGGLTSASKRLKREGQEEETAASGLGFSAIKLSDIMSYAHRISYTTFAPPGFGAGQMPLHGALPPAPQEEQMRASLLYQCADLDIGLPFEPKTGEKEMATLIEVVQPPPPALSNVMLPPVPSGWRPGMPIELPQGEYPAIPPGWKPGDPVSLPLMEVPAGWKPGGPVPLPKMEEMPPLPVRPVGAAAQEPIPVRFVQLDINPDEDDYGSEYSSDEASSDDDE